MNKVTYTFVVKTLGGESYLDLGHYKSLSSAVRKIQKEQSKPGDDFMSDHERKSLVIRVVRTKIDTCLLTLEQAKEKLNG